VLSLILKPLFLPTSQHVGVPPLPLPLIRPLVLPRPVLLPLPLPILIAVPRLQLLCCVPGLKGHGLPTPSQPTPVPPYSPYLAINVHTRDCIIAPAPSTFAACRVPTLHLVQPRPLLIRPLVRPRPRLLHLPLPLLVAVSHLQLLGCVPRLWVHGLTVIRVVLSTTPRTQPSSPRPYIPSL
jgi:hypothetical protein